VDSAYISLLWGDSLSSLSAVPPAYLYSLHEVDTSPVLVNITSSATDPAKTECTGQGLFTGTANRASSFRIIPRDSYRNLRDDDDLYFLASQLFSAKLTLVDGAKYGGSGAEVVIPTIENDADSHSFLGSYTPQLAGTYSLEVAYQSAPDAAKAHVSGSPFTVYVVPDVTFGPYSRFISPYFLIF